MLILIGLVVALGAAFIIGAPILLGALALLMLILLNPGAAALIFFVYLALTIIAKVKAKKEQES